MLRNVEIVGMADVVSFSFGEVLFAVFLHLDLGQGSRIAIARFGISPRDQAPSSCPLTTNRGAGL